MNGAQLSMAHRDSSGLMSGPPASGAILTNSDVGGMYRIDPTLAVASLVE